MLRGLEPEFTTAQRSFPCPERTHASAYGRYRRPSAPIRTATADLPDWRPTLRQRTTLADRSAYSLASFSSAEYCGVSPHLDATLTTSTARPSYSPNEVGTPPRVLIDLDTARIGEALPEVVPIAAEDYAVLSSRHDSEHMRRSSVDDSFEHREVGDSSAGGKRLHTVEYQGVSAIDR